MLEPIILSSEKMLEFACNKQWREFQRQLAQRDRQIAQLMTEIDVDNPPADLRDDLLRLQQLNKQLQAVANDEHQSISVAIKALAKGDKARAAYRENK